MVNSLTIIPTLHAEHLAKRMAVLKTCEIVYLETNKDGKRFFPDGEIYVKIPDVKLNDRIVVLHSGAPDPNGGILELEMLIQALIDAGHKNIDVFFSYFPYGMQDNPKHTGETNAAKNILHKLINYYGINRIYIVDAHFLGQPWLDKYPIINVSAVTLLKKVALADYPSAIFLAPDQGAQRRMLMGGTKKIRKNSFEIAIVHDDTFLSTINGQVVGVIDDLVETGGTAARFAETCRKGGSKDVIALITHGLLEIGIQKLRTSYSKTYITNSIDCTNANVDISGLILDAVSSTK